MDTQGLFYSRNRESFKIMQTICFLELPSYAERWGKLDHEHLSAVYSILIEITGGGGTQKKKPQIVQ